MSAKPYGDEAVGVLIRVLRGERVSELENETTFEWGEDTNARIAATLNALKARLAAAEAEAERAAELLVEASGWMKAECYSLHHRRNQYHASDEACPVEALQSELLARIDAHLASRPEGEVAP